MRPVFAALALWFALCLSARSGVAPVPESEQAALAMKLIDAYHSPRPASPPKKLQVVYFTPADREPAAHYQERLEAILEDIQAFYRDNMQRLGFGPETFPLARDANGKWIIQLVKGKAPESAFTGWVGRNHGNTGSPASGDMVKHDCETAGISFNYETVLIFCHLATYDQKAGTFRHHSPYFGRMTDHGGLCFAADWAEQNLTNLNQAGPMLNDGEYGNMTLGHHTTVFLGGIAHELGHALTLPHCGERWDERALGTSLMGGGNHTYREERRGEGKGSFLTIASAMRLASHPLFNGSDKGENEPVRLEQCDLMLTTNLMRADLAHRRGALRVEGTVKGSPPIYGVVAYFDSAHDDGYLAPTATSVPDANGQFAIEISDLAPSANCVLRVEFCHVNGQISTRQLGFRVTPAGSVDISQWQMRRALEPVAAAVANNQLADAQAALKKLEADKTPESWQNIARKLIGTLEPGTSPSPADAPDKISELPLGDAHPQTAEVGWLKPAANRIPPNDQITSPFLDSGKIYATGLYAHSPSRYVFDLGGKWKSLRGEAGLHTVQQPYGAVVFVIKTDGKEVYRSAAIRGAAKASYDVDVTGVKTLELIVASAHDENGNNWGLWLDPALFREPQTNSRP